MSEEAKPQITTEQQEFDIQHDDEFEDFKVKYTPIGDRTGEQMDDWDDDVLEDLTKILQEQRSSVK